MTRKLRPGDLVVFDTGGWVREPGRVHLYCVISVGEKQHIASEGDSDAWLLRHDGALVKSSVQWMRSNGRVLT